MPVLAWSCSIYSNLLLNLKARGDGVDQARTHRSCFVESSTSSGAGGCAVDCHVLSTMHSVHLQCIFALCTCSKQLMTFDVS